MYLQHCNFLYIQSKSDFILTLIFVGYIPLLAERIKLSSLDEFKRRVKYSFMILKRNKNEYVLPIFMGCSGSWEMSDIFMYGHLFLSSSFLT